MDRDQIHDVDVYVGEQLRQWREKQGHSQKALGEVVGVSFQQIQKYETGKNRISPGYLFALSQFLEIPICVLFPEEHSCDISVFIAECNRLESKIEACQTLLSR